ncbi:RNA polymerase B, partial [Tulasnella sp. 427]
MSLRRRHQVEEEDAATLKLGSEFNNAGCLMVSEVKMLLVMREEAGRTAPDTAVFKKTKAYVDTFAKFTDDSARSVREALRREIDERGLTQFEIAQIANLCPATSEEAKNCIP